MGKSSKKVRTDEELEAKPVLPDGTIIIDSTVLKETMKPLLSFCTSGQNEIFALIRILSYENIVKIIARNEEGQIEIVINDCVLKGKDIDAIVVGKSLFDIVKSSVGNLEIKVNDETLTIRFGKSIYKIPTVDDDGKYKSMVDEEAVEAIKYNIYDCERLKYKIGCIDYALSSDDLHESLHHVYVYDNYLVASDGVVGAVTKYNGINKLNGNIIPLFAIRLITGFSGDKIGLICDNDKLYGRILSDKYNIHFVVSIPLINYPADKLIEIIKGYEKAKDGAVSIVFPPVNTLLAVKRLCILADKEVSAVNVFISPTSDIMKMTIHNNNYHGDESIGVTIEHHNDADYEIQVDGKLLTKILNVLNGDCYFRSISSNGVQYIADSETIVFFYGLK